MPSFPTSVWAPTTKTTGQTIQAAHINDAQDEIVAIEGGYLNGTARLNSSNLNVTGASTFIGAVNITGNSTLSNLSVSGNSSLTGSLNVAGGSTFASVSVSGNSTITGSLNVSNSTVTNLNVSNSTITNLGVTNSTATNLSASNSTITNLNVTNSTISALNIGASITMAAAATITSEAANDLNIVAVASREILFRNTSTTAMRLGPTGGFQVGAPTGGDKGAGTINVATDIFKNNSSYTNPDYVFEHYYTGQIVKFAGNPGADRYHGLRPSSIVETYVRQHYQLPGIGEARGAFERSDMLLEKVEELFLYIRGLTERVKRLESDRRG